MTTDSGGRLTFLDWIAATFFTDHLFDLYVEHVQLITDAQNDGDTP